MQTTAKTLTKFSAEVSNINDMDDIDEAFNELGRFINKKKIVKIISTKRVTKTKTTKQLNHEIVSYKDKQYIVCCVPFNDEYKIFVIDNDKKIQLLISHGIIDLMDIILHHLILAMMI